MGMLCLFCVFFMFGVALINMSVGFFAIQELRASRSVILSEPAIGAAETAAESGLWQLYRTSSQPSNCQTGVDTRVLTASQTLDSRCIKYASATIGVTAGAEYVFNLYDPNNRNGNLNPGYTSIVATYLNGATSLTIRVERLDAILVSSTTIPPGSQATQITLPTSPSDDNRFRVIMSSAGNVTVDVNTNLGMSDFPTLATEGCATQGTDPSSCLTSKDAFRRKLEVLVPR